MNRASLLGGGAGPVHSGHGASPAAPRPLSRTLRPSVLFGLVDIIGKLLALSVVVALARSLSAPSFGEVVAALALANVLAALLDLGVNTRLVALVLTDNLVARYTVVRRYRLLLAFLSVGLALLFVAPVRLSAAALVASVLMTALPTSALLADGRRFFAAVSLVLPNVLFLILVVLKVQASAAEAILLWALSNFGTLLVLWIGVDWLRPSINAPIRTLEVYRHSLPVGLFNVIALAYGRIDTVLVAAIVGAAQAGIYGTYYRVMLAVVSVASWSGSIAARRLADKSHGTAYLSRLLRVLFVLSIPIAGILYLTLPALVDRLIGHPGSFPAPARAAIALVVVPAMLTNALVYFLVVREMQRRLVISSLVIGALAAAAYPIAIITVGITGAAMASLAIEVAACSLFAHQCHWAIRMNRSSDEER